MDEKTAEALERSIRKWEAIANGTGEDNLNQNCALCRAFQYVNGEADCAGCPVMARTGLQFCTGSPWQSWAEAQERYNSRIPWRANTAELKALAQAELDFLKSLRVPASCYTLEVSE